MKCLLFNFIEISRSYFSCDCFLCSNSAPWDPSGVRQCRSYRTRKIVQLEETLVWRFVQHCRSTRARGEEEKEKHRFGYFAYVASIVADVSIPHAGGLLLNLGHGFTLSYFSRLLTLASCYYRHTRKYHGVHVIFCVVSWLVILYSVLDTWTWKPTGRTEF